MSLYQKIIAGGLVLAGLVGLYGCKKESNNQNQKPAESRLEYFLDKGTIGNPRADWGRSGTAISFADLDADGDLDMITSTPERIKYWENTGSRTNPQYTERGVIGDPGADWGSASVGNAIGDMDRDGDLDLVTASPERIKYWENTGSRTNPQYTERGVIGDPGADWGRAKVGIALADLDGDGDLDVITASAKGIKYFNNNTLPQKNK